MSNVAYQIIGALGKYAFINDGQAALLRGDVEESIPLRRACIERGYTTPETYATVLSFLTHIPIIDLRQASIDQYVRKLVPKETAMKYGVVPMYTENQTLVVVMGDPTNMEALEESRLVTGLRVEPRIALNDTEPYVRQLYG